MVFASLFMVVLIAALVVVSRASTFGKTLVQEWSDVDSHRPSQQILDLVAAMSPSEKITQFPSLTLLSSGESRENPELVTTIRAPKVRVSAMTTQVH